MVSKDFIGEVVADILIRSGVAPNKRGFIYLKEGAIYAFGKYPASFKVVKDVYRNLATDFGATPLRVERNIRYALKNMDLNDFNASVGKNFPALPTPKKFFIYLCEYLEQIL